MSAAHQTPPSALITGIAGQDGSYLAELLLDKGYQVHGLVHSSPSDSLRCSEHLRGSVKLIQGDLLDRESLSSAVSSICPDELYHLAAPSFVPASWESPAQTFAEIAGSTATLLEAVRQSSPKTRVFVASSCAMFGATAESPQREDTPFSPQTPYAVAKLAGHQLTGLVREHHRIYACSGILYNHESERRPESFLPRKITRAAARIKLGLAERVTLGDLHAVRDWSFAKDVMHGAWLSLQQERPGDYILASGEGHTVSELAQVAFAHVGLHAADHIEVDERFVRAPERTPPVGDPSKARAELRWQPTISFEQLIERMVDADLADLSERRERPRP